jgi:rSAM/selenodomain-associated transferase 2
MAGLSVVIPALNEAGTLPLLLADLGTWPGNLETLVVDGGSGDATAAVSRNGGARLLRSPASGRGQQLRWGAAQADGPWLLVLHADSRLPTGWVDAVTAVLERPDAETQAWYFDFKVSGTRPMLRLLEQAVAWRSRWRQRPYGDQGLLIHRRLYTAVGGYRPIPLMEDLDLVQRLAARSRLRRIGHPLITSGRRWQRQGVLRLAWRNALLRRRWARGESADGLARDYTR